MSAGRWWVGALVLGFGLAGVAEMTWAQSPDGVGVRASGMAGAFVAIADDPSAVVWNPAGLAAGAFFGAGLDIGAFDLPRAADEERLNRRVWQVALVTPPLGLSYTGRHLRGRDRRPGVGAPPGASPVGRLDTQAIGVTVLQSLADGVAVGATMKILRGTAAVGVVGTPTSGTLHDAAGDLPGRSGFAFDVDLGLHAVRGPVRVGLLVSSVANPSFDTEDGGELAVGRQVRAGVALQPDPRVTVSFDTDLLVTETLEGERRRAGVGAEFWDTARRYGVRGGMRVETRGDLRPVATLGASVAARPGLFVEGFGAMGASDADRGWGLALRMTF